jgi:thiol-disulfide isomerase/thioredoxin
MLGRAGDRRAASPPGPDNLWDSRPEEAVSDHDDRIPEPDRSLAPDADLAGGPSGPDLAVDRASTGSTRRGPVMAVGILAIVLAAVSAFTLWQVLELRSDLEEQRSLLAFELRRSMDEAADRVVDGIGREVESSLAAVIGRAGGSGDGGASATLQRGDTVASITGPEWSSGEEITIDFADGTPRLVMVWAHWCPYCQQELPGLVDLAATGGIPEGVELVTITTSIDPTRGNPLDDYLSGLQPGFPVIVDGDGRLAAALRTTAFPYWVIVAGDGTVLGSATGALPEGDPKRILDQLAELG